MAQERNQLDELDRLMLEAAEAQQAGVFGSTPIDVEALVAKPVLAGPAYWYQHLLVGLPLAACIAMFFGIAALWHAGSGPGDDLTNGTTAVSTFGGTVVSAIERCQTPENLRNCLSGPGTPVSNECRCVDFDGDGDVDLRDLGAFQVNSSID